MSKWHETTDEVIFNEVTLLVNYHYKYEFEEPEIGFQGGYLISIESVKLLDSETDILNLINYEKLENEIIETLISNGYE